jgi:hypothetical protein
VLVIISKFAVPFMGLIPEPFYIVAYYRLTNKYTIVKLF